MIKTEGLKKSFEKHIVFDGADIAVEDGSVCGLIGINGAGKSTLLRILSGVIRHDEGKVSIDGMPVYDNQKVKKDIFFLPDDPYYDSNFNVKRLRDLYAAFYDFDKEKFDEYIKTFGLPADKPIRNFSKGMRRQAFIAVAFSCKTKYLFLDEAFDGLDPLCRMEFKRGLIECKERGTTVIISSHSLRELEDICDSFILIDSATVKQCGALVDALENIFKLQFAFGSDDFTREKLPFEVLRFSKVGKVITIVAHGNSEEAVKQITAMSPLFVEEIQMDFEDMFIEEVQSRGYLKGEEGN
ncbi:MAG: ABC transporter ATP-binding protein [Clostridiales bacterium]|nr:ABC transporter ATP-binding protein [Clostridiales bacterium]